MATKVSSLNNNVAGYYDRTGNYKTGLDFDQHVFIAGRILQSAEMNEIQISQQNRLKNVTDSLFKDGDIVRDCRIVISGDASTGYNAMIESGAVYLQGAVRGVPEKSNIMVKPIGTTALGVWMSLWVYDASDDKALLDPATGTQAYNEQGSSRLYIKTEWGTQDEARTDEQFFPVYYADDGQLRAKEPPPNLDSVTQSIARYDVDSNGSNYVVNGLRVTRLDDEDQNGTPFKVFNIEAGRARVNGFGIALNSSRRISKEINPLSKDILSESRTSQGEANLEVKLTRGPLNLIKRITYTEQKTFNIQRAQSGTTDPFLDADNNGVSVDSVTSIVSISQGATTYVAGTDYDTDPQNVSWLAGGKAPAFGSTYSITVLRTVTIAPWDPVKCPLNADGTGYFVKGTVKGTQVLTDYSFKLPRIDRLVVDETGAFKWIFGAATDYNPAPPQVPNNVLAIAQVSETWVDETTQIINDGVRMISMSTLEAMGERMDTLTDLVAQLNLVSDINTRESSAKKGVFVDPFVGDNMRNAGFTPTNTGSLKGNDAAISGGALQLPISATPISMPADVTSKQSCAFTFETVLGNEARTSSMAVNPYQAFDPFPGEVTLTPQIDRWVDTKTTWLSDVTRYFVTTVYAPWSIGSVHGQTLTTGQTNATELAGTTTSNAEYLREIDVEFEVRGFGAGEALKEMRFDNMVVVPDNK